MAHTITATGRGIKAATLYENMAVNKVVRNQTIPFIIFLCEGLFDDCSYNLRQQKSSSKSKYDTATNATEPASPLDRYIAIPELKVRNAKLIPVSQEKLSLSILACGWEVVTRGVLLVIGRVLMYAQTRR